MCGGQSRSHFLSSSLGMEMRVSGVEVTDAPKLEMQALICFSGNPKTGAGRTSEVTADCSLVPCLGDTYRGQKRWALPLDARGLCT